MIYIDDRDGNPKEIQASLELRRHIRDLGLLCDIARLDSADFCFEGYGDMGRMLIGVERKTLHDLLHCIDDGHYNQQRITMSQTYRVNILLVEGLYKCSSDGLLLEGWPRKDGSISWGFCRYRSKPVLYSKLRYLMSVALSGVIITHARSLPETAIEVGEWFRYFQTPWHDHTSLLSVQELAIPALGKSPSLTRQWASRIDGIGVKRSGEAEALFGTPIRLANSEELDWMKLSGVGAPTAIDIIKQIHGRERKR